MVNEHGVSLSRNTGMKTKQVQVIKCKDCGEILSEEHNYHYSTEDLAQIKAKELKEKPRRYVYAALCIFFAFLTLAFVRDLLMWHSDSWANFIFIPMFAVPAWFFRPWKEDICE